MVYFLWTSLYTESYGPITSAIKLAIKLTILYNKMLLVVAAITFKF